MTDRCAGGRRLLARWVVLIAGQHQLAAGRAVSAESVDLGVTATADLLAGRHGDRVPHPHRGIPGHRAGQGVLGSVHRDLPARFRGARRRRWNRRRYGMDRTRDLDQRCVTVGQEATDRDVAGGVVLPLQTARAGRGGALEYGPVSTDSQRLRPRSHDGQGLHALRDVQVLTSAAVGLADGAVAAQHVLEARSGGERRPGRIGHLLEVGIGRFRSDSGRQGTGKHHCSQRLGGAGRRRTVEH